MTSVILWSLSCPTSQLRTAVVLSLQCMFSWISLWSSHLILKTPQEQDRTPLQGSCNRSNRWTHTHNDLKWRISFELANCYCRPIRGTVHSPLPPPPSLLTSSTWPVTFAISDRKLVVLDAYHPSLYTGLSMLNSSSQFECCTLANLIAKIILRFKKTYPLICLLICPHRDRLSDYRRLTQCQITYYENRLVLCV
jgi:hypothetical protein